MAPGRIISGDNTISLATAAEALDWVALDLIELDWVDDRLDDVVLGRIELLLIEDDTFTEEAMLLALDVALMLEDTAIDDALLDEVS